MDTCSLTFLIESFDPKISWFRSKLNWAIMGEESFLVNNSTLLISRFLVSRCSSPPDFSETCLMKWSTYPKITFFWKSTWRFKSKCVAVKWWRVILVVFIFWQRISNYSYVQMISWKFAKDVFSLIATALNIFFAACWAIINLKKKLWIEDNKLRDDDLLLLSSSIYIYIFWNRNKPQLPQRLDWQVGCGN